MPTWGLVAAGRLPDDDPGASGELHQLLAGVLSDTRYGCVLSELHVDADPKIRTIPHDDRCCAAAVLRPRP